MPRQCTCRLNRTRSDARQLVADQESPLHEHAENIVFVQDPIVNEISSTKVRGELAQVRLIWLRPRLPLFTAHAASQEGLPVQIFAEG